MDILVVLLVAVLGLTAAGLVRLVGCLQEKRS
jgi:hypothetical protein